YQRARRRSTCRRAQGRRSRAPRSRVRVNRRAIDRGALRGDDGAGGPGRTVRQICPECTPRAHRDDRKSHHRRHSGARPSPREAPLAESLTAAAGGGIVKVKCFACDAVIEADDSDAVSDAFVAHGLERHAWSYPQEAIRNYARNYAEAIERLTGGT